jgi:hypothetical protein
VERTPGDRFGYVQDVLTEHVPALVARVRELEAAGFETVPGEHGKVWTLCRVCHVAQDWDEYPTGHVAWCWFGAALNG